MTSSASNDILGRYLARTAGSRQWAEKAQQSIAGGVVSDTRVFDPYGIYVTRAHGARKWDVDGNEYLDLFGGHGANMLGHAHPVMVAAVQHTVADGVQFAANQPLEVLLAAKLQRLVASAERIRFTGSGTEATLLALRLARAYTQRPRILRIASNYHGWHDAVASGYAGEFDGGPAPGVLAEVARQTTLVRPNDFAALEAAVDAHGSELAALIVEPVGTHFGVVPVSPEFLTAVQDAAARAGALFILDEVLSGFRVAMGGAQSVFGLQPDLTTFAKVLCGGMPGGALAGRGDVMSLLDADIAARGQRPKVMHQGTFTGNPVSMASGLATLEELERIDGCGTANRLGEMARMHLREAFNRNGLPFFCYGAFSIFHILIRTDGGVADVGLEESALPMEAYLTRPQPTLNRLRMALNVLGVDVNTKGSGLFSAVHTPSDVEQTVDAFTQAGRMLREEGLIA